MDASRTRLLGLSRKYRVLTALRRGALTPSEMRPLAREFPGALRELDTLPMTLLEQRLHAVSEAERGEPPEPWIEWMLAYHERMRLALDAKQRLGGARPADAQRIEQVAEELSRESSTNAGTEFVAQVSDPPGGRLNRLVFELLEQELGRPRAELERALFPGKTRD